MTETTANEWPPSPYQDRHIMSHNDNYQAPHHGNASYNDGPPQ